MRPGKGWGVLLLALLPGVLLGQQMATRPKSAAWAMSGNERISTPQVIATTRPEKAMLPPEARLPLPDDGLRLIPAQATTASAAARMPGLLPNLPVSPSPNSPIQQAVYVPRNDPAGQAPIQRVSHLEPSPGHTVTSASEPTPPPRLGSLLSLELLGPASITPGENVSCQLVVRNPGSLVLSGVQVELPIPLGVRVPHSKPEAQRQGDRLVWHLGNFEAGGERQLEFELQVSQAGQVQLVPAARFAAPLAWRSNVIRPPFSLTVTHPEAASVGEKIVMQLQIANNTSEVLRRIGLRCELSPGLLHEQGQIIEADLGEDLAPGQVRSVQLDTQANQAGRQTATLTATAEGGQTARTNAVVLVNETALTLQAQGPRRANLNQDVTLGLEVANPSQRGVGPVRVSQLLPQGVEFLSANHGGLFNPILSTVTWTLPQLDAQQRLELASQVRTRQAGDWAVASHVVVEGRTPVRAIQAIQVEATPSLTLEVTPMDDPIGTGRDTVYEMRVYNAGPGVARGTRLMITVPEVLTPVSCEGPTAWQIRGQQVYFEPLPELHGRMDAMFKLRVRGAHPGQGPFRVEVHAAGVTPALKQELTSHVHALRPPGNRPPS